MEEQEIRNRIVRKMLKNQIVGSHKKQLDTAVSQIAGLPSHEEGRGKDLLEKWYQIRPLQLKDTAAGADKMCGYRV